MISQTERQNGDTELLDVLVFFWKARYAILIGAVAGLVAGYVMYSRSKPLPQMATQVSVTVKTDPQTYHFLAGNQKLYKDATSSLEMLKIIYDSVLPDKPANLDWKLSSAAEMQKAAPPFMPFLSLSFDEVGQSFMGQVTTPFEVNPENVEEGVKKFLQRLFRLYEAEHASDIIGTEFERSSIGLAQVELFLQKKLKKLGVDISNFYEMYRGVGWSTDTAIMYRMLAFLEDSKKISASDSKLVRNNLLSIERNGTLRSKDHITDNLITLLNSDLDNSKIQMMFSNVDRSVGWRHFATTFAGMLFLGITVGLIAYGLKAYLQANQARLNKIL
jgi:hypothetical protein